MSLMRLRPFVPALGLLLVVATSAPAGPRPNWPQWRGPTRDGRVAPGAAWPEKLDQDHLTLRWRVELGPSYSGPIIVADRVFVTETLDEKGEVARALDRDTGKERWAARWPATFQVPDFARENGNWARSTPACDGDALYVGGMRDVLVCLDADGGKERWRVDFAEQFRTPLPVFGMASSPLVDGDAVFVQAAAGVARVDRKTGKVAWREVFDDPRQFGGATSSPVLAELAGQRQLVVLNRKVLAGLDPVSGKVLWRHDTPAYRNTTTLTPLVLPGDGVFTSMFNGRSFRFDVAARDQGLTARIVWDSRANGNLSSPVLVGDHIYLHLQNQRLTCLEARTGKTAWVTDRTFGKYWSMTVNGDRVLALDQQGILYLFRANPRQFELLDRRKVSEEETWAHLAVCGDEVFVRDLKGLSAYRWRAPEQAR
jgi:outer membrane protein assembly factor BamB